MRLIAFGCSLTYGTGLDDCWTGAKSGPVPSVFAWPQLVGNALNRNVINRGQPGASNKEIWHDIVNFEFQPDDVVIVSWTKIDRSCTIKFDKPVDRYGAGNISTSNKSKAYFEHIHDSHDSKLDFFLRCNHVAMLINAHHIMYMEMDPPKWNTVEFLDLHWKTLQPEYPRALDKQHPGIQAHKRYAEIILSQLEYKDGL